MFLIFFLFSSNNFSFLPSTLVSFDWKHLACAHAFYHIAEIKYEPKITLTLSENYDTCSSSQHSSNDYKGAVYQNEGNNISSPARRSEVSPIQYHVSMNPKKMWNIKYFFIFMCKVIKRK